MSAEWGLLLVVLALAGGYFALAWRAERSRRVLAENHLRDIAAASHDLLQPVNAARLFNATLRSDVAGDDSLRGLTDRVECALVCAEEQLEGLLDVARLESDALQAQPASFPLGALLESLHQQFAPTARQRGIELRVMPTRVMVHTDQRLLRRVLQNLISNALRHTRSGEVVVGVRRRVGVIELQVCDTGPGIEPEYQALVFEEFRRLDRPSPWGEQGLGLGLYICKRIGSILNTPVTLRSQPGRGSVFSVCIPRASARQPHPVRVAGPRAPPAYDCWRRTFP